MRYPTALLSFIASAAALAQPAAQPPSASPAVSVTAPVASASGPVASDALPMASNPAPVASAPAKAPSQKIKEPPPQSALTGPLMYQLLLSELTFGEGTPESAQEGGQIMLDAARRMAGKTPDDQTLFKRATVMALQSGSGPDALAATRAWRMAMPHSAEANRYELQMLIVLDRIEETVDPIRRVLETLPSAEQEDFIVALPTLYKDAQDKPLAARTVERALANAIKSPSLAPAAWSSIGRLRLQAGDEDGALTAATLGTTNSEWTGASAHWPILLALQLMSDAHSAQIKTAAETLVKNDLQANASSHAAKPGDQIAQVQLRYAVVLAAAARPQEALAQLQQLTTRQPDYLDGWLDLGSLYVDQGQSSHAQLALERYLSLAEQQTEKVQAAQVNQPAGKPAPTDLLTARQRSADMDSARLLLARLAEKRGDTKAANQWLAAVRSPEQMLAVTIQRAALLANQGRLEEARALIRSVPERSPDDAVFKLRAEAQLLSNHQHPDQAYTLLTRALASSPNDKGLIYDTAIVASKANRFDDEERLLRHLMELNPQSAIAYNALGYDLADRGVRLQEAKELIEKAVALTPDDVFVRDSLGWVQYRLGNLPEAQRLLESAFKQQPDPEIAAHLGEVLWVQGQHDAARTIWRQGLKLDAKNQTLQKTLRRFKVPQL